MFLANLADRFSPLTAHTSNIRQLMALHWPTFFTRLGSAIVFAAVMISGLLWNEWGFAALAALIQFLCLRDYFRLMKKIHQSRSDRLVYWLSQLSGLLLLIAVQLSIAKASPSLGIGWQGKSGHPPGTLAVNIYQDVRPALLSSYRVTYWPLILFLPALIFLVAGLSENRSLMQAQTAFSGLMYIVLPCILLLALYQLAWHLPLVLVLCIWMNDTMAYLVGSFIGRTPFSKISPKKTWEGTAGGAILTITGAAITAWLIPHQSIPMYTGIALCAAITGTAGDLLESKLKRIAGVKDSGTMMPGHGGALDRFDSLLIATPFAFAYAYLLIEVLPIKIF